MPRVLLVEDEEHLAAGIRFNLELDGYEVETLSDGLRAVERLAPEPEGPMWEARPDRLWTVVRLLTRRLRNMDEALADLMDEKPDASKSSVA